MVHLATVDAVIPATPGRSLQCCSQQRDRERSGCADKADMKRDWCILSEEIAGDDIEKIIKQTEVQSGDRTTVYTTMCPNIRLGHQSSPSFGFYMSYTYDCHRT